MSGVLRAGSAQDDREKEQDMKTLAIRETDNGNYIVYYPGIRGQQSHGDDVLVFAPDGQELAEKKYHDIAQWHERCRCVAMIGGVLPGKEREIFEQFLATGIEGYTTASQLATGEPRELLPPLNAVGEKLPKPKRRRKFAKLEVEHAAVADSLQD
jgi:hypothetical protein